MPIQNSEIAAMLSELGDLLEIDGADQFRIRAYRNAARVVTDHSRSLAEMAAAGEDLREIPGIGKTLAEKIEMFVKERSVPQLEELRAKFGPSLSQLMQIPDLGAKRVKRLRDELGISTADQLRTAAERGKIHELRGFGEKMEEKILETLARAGQQRPRLKLADAEQTVRPLLSCLRGQQAVKAVQAAGSFRRRKETVGDLDILAACRKSSEAARCFVRYEDVERVLSEGDTRSSVLLRSGLQVDLRVVPPESWGAALLYFTGSKAFNIAVRRIAQDRGWKINEYGLFEDSRRLGGESEEQLFSALDLPYIEPELREDTGEIDAAREHRLPRLVRLEDIKGDLHTHSKWTDGRYTIRDMALAARARGYKYIGVSDHSQHLTVAKGLTPARLRQQMKEIDRLNEEGLGITILKGIEVDILEDGKLDLPDSILKELDFTICSIHSRFNLSPAKQTNRLLRAINNRYANIIGHPTGRFINAREPYQFDLERVMRHAAEAGCALEVNSHPDRLDLNDTHCRMAGEIGVKLAINTDAHDVNHLSLIEFGVGQARRGWVEAKQVINSCTLSRLRNFFGRGPWTR